MDTNKRTKHDKDLMFQLGKACIATDWAENPDWRRILHYLTEDLHVASHKHFEAYFVKVQSGARQSAPPASPHPKPTSAPPASDTRSIRPPSTGATGFHSRSGSMQRAPSPISTSGDLSEAGSQFENSDTSSSKSAPNDANEVKYWSYSRQVWRPCICIEGDSHENWISMRIAEQTGLEIRPHSCGRPECRGVLPLMWHPRHSIKTVEGEFHVTVEDNMPDLVVGKDKMADATMAQEAGRSQEGLERLLQHQGLSGRSRSWSRPADLLTPMATPSPGRAGLSLSDTPRDTPLSLNAVSIPTVIKTSESVSGISDTGSSRPNGKTTDSTNYPPRTRLFSQATHSVVQGASAEPPSAVHERSKQTEIDARTISRIKHLKAGVRFPAKNMLCV
ncbi:hypothetical protein EPUS_09191 [Endocarpon pusillum Z07020]|uniref:Uncharacterized protein n=1 Tax=Endocarpon pusillum (strain Z07020 / HMAS-L-300199) TaxID=1263415 RepID=U1G6W6_ENDPU|nr:uncharacterized protein EPUS_09191 [Endocarpon pusillum Z07020]ERF73117.1 hypothetical protein EPUS_09191 [Endocarpon pusillum Z07020]